MRQNQNKYYDSNKGKHLETFRKYFDINREKVSIALNKNKDQAKMKHVISQRNDINVEDSAKILIQANNRNLSIFDINIHIEFFLSLQYVS